jgi:hypothetical protein
VKISKSTKNYILIVLGAVLLALLYLPGSPTPQVTPAKSVPFAWNRDQLWTSLEKRLDWARSKSCEELDPVIDQEMAALGGLVRNLENGNRGAEDTSWDQAELSAMNLAPLLAACPRRVAEFTSTLYGLRHAAKKQARNWPPRARATRERLYRLLYGQRSVLEELMLQLPRGAAPAMYVGKNAPSAAPAVKVRGITLHSGDILVSRGGAPTSALIARGSDFPGNFSHVALLYVNPETRKAQVIEALIEYGVQINSLEDYFKDKKLRILVLRLRPGLPALAANPDLAHEAAKDMYELAKSRHIPYDFAMDWQNHQKMFCSEVVYAAYKSKGVELWPALSHISAKGTAAWLADFGVRHFVTQTPADLEYDPSLAVAGEWRDVETLFKDHVDNAVTDAMLESADKGMAMDYNRLLLGPTRVTKVYSMLKNLFGAYGPVPEGMPATAALKNLWYSARHEALAGDVLAQADEFKKRKGYTPPYWELVAMARRAQAKRQ